MNASIDQIKFLTTSRKDDLQSLCYLLCQLLRKGHLPYVVELFKYYSKQKLSDSQQTYHAILEAKEKMSTNDTAHINC